MFVKNFWRVWKYQLGPCATFRSGPVQIDLFPSKWYNVPLANGVEGVEM